jgi:hypothetical protein
MGAYRRSATFTKIGIKIASPSVIVEQNHVFAVPAQGRKNSCGSGSGSDDSPLVYAVKN